MKSVLFNSYEVEAGGRPRQVLSVFIACHNLTANDFDAAIAGAISTAVAPDSVHIVGYQEDVDKVRSWLMREDNVSLDRLRTVVDTDGSALCFIAFEADVGRQVPRLLDGTKIDEFDLVENNRRGSLLSAFREAGGVQRAPVGTHFAKTSDSHSDRFLRVSNVLEDGAAVRLVAFWLIPYLWRNEITSVIVDTSGIFSVALTAIHETATRGGLIGNPLVWSHKSHEGVNAIETHRASTALFLISASTSGGLSQRLISRGATQDRIVTLFSLSAGYLVAGNVLCDLLEHDGKKGIAPIENHKAGACPLCDGHLHVIRIQGDQFSIAPPNVTLIEIKADDLPNQIKLETAALLGLRAFVAFRRRTDGRIATLGLNVDSILNGELSEKNRTILTAKREKWAEFVRRSSAVSTRHVVKTSYPGSDKIADRISSDIRDSLRDNETPVSVTPESLRAASPQPGTSTIVVAACIDEAKELLSVSRTLRDVQEGGSTSYIAVADMIGPKAEHDRLRSNLTFGKHGSGTFSLHTLFSLPLECYEEEASWETEINELRRVIDWADREDRDIPEEIERRVQRLQTAPAEGLIDDLFWASIDGHALMLRSDFTLIGDARRDPAATQADLFAVVCLVLSSLRYSAKVNRRLAHNAYERAVLTPHNFDRFNDGVLQACLLRAARPKELAYGACDPSVSEQMLEVLRHALPNREVPEKCEALAEFLIALLTRRMTLRKEHLLDFCHAVTQIDFEGTEVVKLIAAYLINREKAAAVTA